MLEYISLKSTTLQKLEKASITEQIVADVQRNKTN